GAQLRLPVLAAALGTAALVAVAPAAANGHHGKQHHHGAKPVYVSLNGSANKSGHSCKQAKYNSIQDAIEAAHLKGTVVVCKGTYPGGVNLDRRLILAGKPGATIDATGDAYGIGVSASYATVVGVNVADDLGAPATHNKIAFNVANKNFGGCGIALADHSGAGVTDNLVAFNMANDNGLSTPTAPNASAGSGVILASPVLNGIVTG